MKKKFSLLRVAALIFSLLLLTQLYSCNESSISSMEESSSDESESSEAEKIAKKPKLSPLNHPEVDTSDSTEVSNRLQNIPINYFLDNTGSQIGFIKSSKNGTYLKALNDLNEIFNAYEAEYSGNASYHKLSLDNENKWLFWEKSSKEKFNFESKDFYSGPEGGLGSNPIKGDVGPLRALLDSKMINYDTLNVVVSDLNEQMQNSESLANGISKEVFSKSGRTVGIFTIMCHFKGNPYVYSSSMIDEYGNYTYSEDENFNDKRAFYILYFGPTEYALDFQNRLISKLGDEVNVKCGNTETFASKKDFNEKVFSSDNTLYYFYDSVSYADGNKPFGVEEYNKMLADSAKFEFPAINYDRVFYDSALQKYIGYNEVKNPDSPPYVTPKNSPFNFMLKKCQDIRDIFSVEGGDYYYSLNFSFCGPGEQKGDMKEFFVPEYTGEAKLYVAIPLGDVAHGSAYYYVPEKSIEVYLKKNEYETSSNDLSEESDLSDNGASEEAVSVDEESNSDKNGDWESKFYAELFPSRSLVVSYFALDGERNFENGKYVEIIGDTNVKLDVVPRYPIHFPEINGEYSEDISLSNEQSVSTKYEKIEGNHIFFEISFADLKKYVEDEYGYLTVRIPVRINTRNRASIQEVPKYVKYLSTPGTEYVKGGDNNDFFRRTVDFSEFYNAYFGNSFSEDVFDSIFDCQVCEVVVNIKLQ